MSVSEILERLPAGLDVSQVQNLDNFARLLAQNAGLDHAAAAGSGAPGADGRMVDTLPGEVGFVTFGEQLAAAGMAFDLHAQRLARAFADADLRHVA